MRKPIVSNPEILSGTPVFLGTRIPLDHVASLIQRGVSEQELTEDFPSLNQDDFEYARTYAQTYVSPSGPPKPLKIRRRPTRAA